KRAIRTKWVYRNKKNERGIVVRNKARLVAQGYTQEEGIDYNEFLDKVFKVEKDLYGLHQAPRAWYETLSTYLLENRYRRGTIDKNLFIKKDIGDILLVQLYVDDIIFGSTKKSLCVEFKQMLHKRFQISSIGFFLGLSENRAHYNRDSVKALVKDGRSEDVDVHFYRFNVRSVMFQRLLLKSHIFLESEEIFRYLKGQPIGTLLSRDFNHLTWNAFSVSDYAGASLDRKSTTGGVVDPLIKCLIMIKFQYGISDEFGVKIGSCKVNAARQDLVLLGERIILLRGFSVNITVSSLVVNDVKQIHATVDGQDVDKSESSVRSDLYFNDEDGITCITNETIFENLALMGYESDSDKLTFQKALFSPQWKYLIHTILHCLSLKSTSWNEFSTNIASAVICLANGQKFKFFKLIFNEPFNDIYKTPVHTKKVFTNMKRKGKDFSGRITPLFASMLAPPVVEGEGSGQPTEPQPAPSTTQPIIEEQIPTSVPIPNVADEAVFKEWDDRVVRATTTAASLDAAQASGNITKTQSTTMSNDPLSQEIGSGDRPRCQEAMGGVIAQTRSERASKHSYDSPLPGVNTPGSDEERLEQYELMDNVPPTPHDSPFLGGHTPGSDEGRPNINELMVICTQLSNRVLALETSRTAQALVIQKLKKKVKILEEALRAELQG
ncbi:putative ribonuclease H-like domain-containing protein, partial [Tanacetum coccineum]